MFTFMATCPLDGLALQATTLLRDREEIDAQKLEVDGDFVKTPHQHIHLGYVDMDATCTNGHRWRSRFEITFERLP